MGKGRASPQTSHVAGSDGVVLQSARESSGMTLEQLQEATGIDAAQLSKLLKADGNPTLYTLQRVADALGKRRVFSLAEK